tara:strand:+ start:1210 stop:2112 length:903 start_codon:yes stop_codon:yes gene_type:complete
MKFENNKIDLVITEEIDGLKISQNGKSYLAKEWKLTEKVLKIIDISIKNGFDKFWVNGHPQNKATHAHYICFSRSYQKPWEYLIGKEANPPEVNYITVNNSHRKVLEVSGIDINWQEVGGKHIKYSPSIKDLSKLIQIIKKYPHEAYMKDNGINEIGDTGFRKEKKLENYLFKKYRDAGYSLKSQLGFIKNTGTNRNKDFPDLIFTNENEVFIVELKLNAATKSDIEQLNRYLYNNQLKEKYRDKKIIGVLIAGTFHQSRIDEAKLNYPYLNLYSFNYEKNNISFFCEYGDQFQFLCEFV